MLTKEHVDYINEKLLARFGRRFDRPAYRLSWSTTAFENRFVEGTEYIGNIKLRDVKAIQNMPKYPKDKDRWVLEILVEIPEQLKHELVGDGGLTYEPLWIFKKGNDEYQEPIDNAVFMLAWMSAAPLEQVMASDSDIYKMEKKEFDECMDIVNDSLPDLAVALKQGHAVFHDSTKKLVH